MFHARNRSARKVPLRRLWKDRRGGVLVYTALVGFVIIGITAFAVDLGSAVTTHTEIQSYSDAASLACATQLTGNNGAIARATVAAQDSLVQNDQTFLDGSDTITITAIIFLSSLDPEVVTADDAEAAYCKVQVTSATLGLPFWSVVLNTPTTNNVTAEAVAGWNSVTCNIPPLMICNPAEAEFGAGAAIGPKEGEQILVKFTGPSSQWLPGGFGLLDCLDGGQGTPCIAEGLANPTSGGCVDSTVDIRTGEANGMRQALNVRYDMYQNPLFGGNKAKNESEYRPARHVIKGYMPKQQVDADGVPMVDADGNPIVNACKVEEADPAVAMGWPRDTCLETGMCPGPLPDRQGDGEWDRDGYWNLNHPGPVGGPNPLPHPANVGFDADGIPIPFYQASRYQMYKWEIAQSMIPDNSATGGEDGNPQCYSGAVPPNDSPDRMLLAVAFVNCLDEGPLNGNEDDVPIIGVATVFLSEPVGGPPDMAFYLEIVGVDIGDSAAVHNIVQLYK